MKYYEIKHSSLLIGLHDRKAGAGVAAVLAYDEFGTAKNWGLDTISEAYFRIAQSNARYDGVYLPLNSKDTRFGIDPFNGAANFDSEVYLFAKSQEAASIVIFSHLVATGVDRLSLPDGLVQIISKNPKGLIKSATELGISLDENGVIKN